MFSDEEKQPLIDEQKRLLARVGDALTRLRNQRMTPVEQVYLLSCSIEGLEALKDEIKLAAGIGLERILKEGKDCHAKRSHA